MRSLFLKIFAIFWLAQSLIFVISTALILRHRFPHPDALRASVTANLHSEATAAVKAFESGGCDGMRAYAGERQQTIDLEDGSGHLLCAPSGSLAPPDAGTVFGDIGGRQIGDRYVWSVPFTSARGTRYVFRSGIHHIPEEHTWYQDLLHFAFPQLPVAIAVGGLTTFVLVMIFTRPLGRLRKAARALAQGDLATRVKVNGAKDSLLGGDEFHALAHDFNHMAERLQSLVDAQKLLLRDVSHELRSPLARLSVALELARDDASAKMIDHIDRIEREAGRLNQLIGQLLTLSSMEAVEGVGSFERVSLNEVIEQIIPDAAYEAQQRQSSVTFHGATDVIVEGKRDLLYRAIENIVRNAIRFTEPGTEVAICLSKSQEGGHAFATLDVSDRGPGIPEAEIDAIFRPFYRVDPARSAHTGGFGVGLAIAERSVKLHHGEVKAFNREAGGTTVRLRFPMI